MTDGFALAPGAAPQRRRGRPPGSKNRRATDLASFMDVTAGGSTALLIAKRSVPTLADVRAAGGDVFEADVALAARAVAAFEAERERRTGRLRDLVREELEACFAQAAQLENAKEVAKLVSKAVARIEDASGGGFTLRAALDAQAENRRALLPYTDQRQAQKVELKADGFAPVMILDTGGAPPVQNVEQFQGPLIDVTPKVSHHKSHDGEEG